MTHLITSKLPVTVLMSCYNASQWLDESVASVLAQTFTEFEFIIVDDGSQDDTLQIARRFAKNDSRIVIISKQNTGLADSLNVGISMARGKWIARLDADDICEPARLEEQYQIANSDPALVFVGSGLALIDQNGVKLGNYLYPSNHDSLVENLEATRRFPPHSSAFYRTDIVSSIGGYRPRIKRAQDIDLWFRLSEVGKLACIAKPLVRIRKHANQISHDESGKRQKLDSRIAMTSYWLRRRGFPDPVAGDEERYRFFRTWIERRLETEGLFESEAMLSQMRAVLVSTPQTLRRVLKLAEIGLRRPTIVLREMRQRLIGDKLPRQLAREWMDLGLRQYFIGDTKNMPELDL